MTDQSVAATVYYTGMVYVAPNGYTYDEFEQIYSWGKLTEDSEWENVSGFIISLTF